MAIYKINITTVGRSSGHSATAKIAYNSRGKIKDIRTGQIFNYSGSKMRADLLYSEITCGDLTINNAERENLWNTAELTEKRSDSRTAREYVLALPKEFTLEQNKNLVREFAKELTNKYGHVADWSIHNEKEDNDNVHVHILTTTRQFDPETKQLGNKTDLELENGTLKKQNKPITQDQIKEIRKNWEVIQNKHLKLAGFDITVSCEKKEDRETVKKHLGKNATALERMGIKTELGNHNRMVDELLALNRQAFSDGEKLAQARAELAILEQQNALEQQRQAELARAEQLRQLEQQARRQMEIAKLEREKAEKAKKDKEYQLELEKTQEKLKQEKFIEAEEMYITGKYCNPLFNVAAAHRDFFTLVTPGHWSSRDGAVTINPERVIMHKHSDGNVKLCLDCAVVKFNSKFVLSGSDKFINRAIEVLASDSRYANVVLDNKDQQERLQSKRLAIEVLEKSKKQPQALELEQSPIEKPKWPDHPYITGKYYNSLYNIAAAHGEFFTMQRGGHYTSRDGAITVYNDRIDVTKTSEQSIKLCVNVAVAKFGTEFVFHGDNEFIKSAINVLANNPLYAKVRLGNPEQQEILESQKLDIEISNAMDLDIDNFDLDAALEKAKAQEAAAKIQALKEFKPNKPRASEVDNDNDFSL